MSNAVAIKKDTLPSLSMDEAELMNVLSNSLYPGAKPESIKMVLGYCKAAGLDPIQKPVHIVPMWDSKSGSMRDVIMPGIGSYRTQASRSGEYAGVSEPEFGPDVIGKWGVIEITYPAWCKVTVRRQLPSGQIVDFTAVERWLENYAVKGGKEKSIAPNTMWCKRPYGQLAKCTEAQALRKAFPEFGAQPTADEMEGKEIDMDTIDRTTGEVFAPARPELQPYSDDAIAKNIDAWRGVVESGKKTTDGLIAFLKTKNTLTAEQEQRIRIELSPAIDAEFTAAYDSVEREAGEEG